MATFQKRGNKWRAIIRRTGYKTLTKTHDTKAQAQRWAAQIEGNIEDQDTAGSDLLVTELIDRYVDELEQYNPPGRSKRCSLEMIRRYLGDRRCSRLSAEVLVDFARQRGNECGPATVQQDIIYLRGLLDAGKRLWGCPIKWDAFDTAASHCRRHGLTGDSVERWRRPTPDEMTRILDHIDHNNYYRSPMGDIVRFAVDTAMRQGEILSIRWQDLDTVKKTIIIHSRKHPSLKVNNHQEVPLLGDSFKLIQKQPKTSDRIFPYQGKSISAAWQRACKKLNIEDLRFHDLRHEGISRLFEQGYGVMEVAKVSGHRDINQLRRYVQLRPEELHQGPSGRRGF